MNVMRIQKLFASPGVGRLVTVFAIVAIIVFPLALLLPLHAHFGGDYDSSHWMTSYDAQYLRRYHHPTNVYQTATSLGIAFPVFYGVLFYRLAGLLSACSSTDIALRILVFGAVAAEILTVYRAARTLLAGRGIALFLCIGVAFSTYELTNLYNRGDLPEFFGVTLVTTALATWFWSRGTKSSVELWLCRAVIAASLTLLGGTHAITMVLGGLTFFLSAALTLLIDRRRSAFLTLGIALLAYLAGASIVIVDYVTIAHLIRFESGIYPLGFTLFPDRIDAPIARFAPFPFDPQTLYQGTINVSTPYLEASIDYALLLFAAGVVIVRRNGLALAFVVMAIVIALISIWPQFWALAPISFHFMQFPYRLTSYVNIMSLCAALTVVWRLPEQVRQVGKTPLPWIAGSVAVIACLIKLSHGFVPLHDVPGAESPSAYMVLGPIAPTHQNYTTNPRTGGPSPVHPLPPEISMLAVGQPLPQRYIADRKGLIYTRILILPWNEIIVDGKRLPPARKLTWADSPYFGFHTTPGSSHIVDTAFVLPRVVDRTIRFAEYSFIFENGAILTILILLLIKARRFYSVEPATV